MSRATQPPLPTKRHLEDFEWIMNHLADPDKVPLLVGMSRLVQRGVLRVDVSAGAASFELKRQVKTRTESVQY